MILSNTTIKNKISEEEIFIGLNKDDKYPLEKLKFDTTSLDLHLGDEFKIWKPLLPGEVSIFDPSESNFSLEELAEHYSVEAHLEEDGSFVLYSGNFVIAKTKEYVKIPSTLAARIEGRSKLGRLGVGIHVTAPTIHAHFEGTITLEIYNHSPRAVRLNPWRSVQQPGLRIAQLVFEKVDGKVEQNDDSTYSGQIHAFGCKSG